jgi:NTE family protein
MNLASEYSCALWRSFLGRVSQLRRPAILVWPLLFTFIPADSSGFQQASQRPKIGVALEGGGAKGLAHIGVLQWFEDHHIPIDYIAGTSMGGLVGGLYATGQSPAEIQRIIGGINWNEALAGSVPYQNLAFRRKEDLRAFPNGLELGLRHGVQPPGGLNSGQMVRLIIDRNVLPYSDVKDFDSLPVPFRCVATDLVSGKPVVLKDGSLATALRATMSIPGAFAPITEDGKVYADGGLLNNLPTDVVKEMGADVVIGVHLSTGPVAPENVRSLFQVTGASSDVMIAANELRGMEQADLLITVDVAGYTTLDFSRFQQIVPKGYEAAKSKSTVLSRFSISDEEWNRYMAQREARRVKAVPIPRFVEVKGTNPEVAKDLDENMSSLVGKPIDTTGLERQITIAAGLGRFNSLSYSLMGRDGQQGLLVTAEEKEYAPPWLKPGFIVDGSDPNNVQFTFGARLVFLDVGGYRSEIRTDFSVGATYSIGSEYYHPLTPTTRWFMAPEFDASRSPLNLYTRGTFLAEYKLNRVDGGFDIGYGFDRFSELRFGYQTGYLNATRWTGSPLLPSVSGRTGTSRIQYVMDRLDNPIIPRRGTALLTDAGWRDANPGAKNGFPSAELNFEAFRPISNPGSLYLIAAGGSTFGYDHTGLPVFSLGGLPRLAAYGINEFLTNQYIYGRIGYLHRLGELPAFLGKGLYLEGHVEVAKPYGVPNVSGVPGDITAGVIMETIFGPVLVGASAGESGHHKWFFQLGRVF